MYNLLLLSNQDKLFLLSLSSHNKRSMFQIKFSRFDDPAVKVIIFKVHAFDFIYTYRYRHVVFYGPTLWNLAHHCVSTEGCANYAQGKYLGLNIAIPTVILLPIFELYYTYMIANHFCFYACITINYHEISIMLLLCWAYRIAQYVHCIIMSS